MSISAWLPSMFAGMSKLQQKQKPKLPQKIPSFITQSFIESANCLDCGKKLKADMRLGIGKCICGSEFSYELLTTPTKEEKTV